MKIRNGFVSNSSSSSFCIFGIAMDPSTIRERIRVVKEDDGSGYIEEEDDNYELIENLLKGQKAVGYHMPEGFDEIYIGESWANVRDDETGAQFKQRIKNEINSRIPGLKDEDFGTFEEAYYS